MVIYIGALVISFMDGFNKKVSIEANPPKMGESVNILVLGMDIGDVNDRKNEAIRRTDTIMLINYHPETKRANVVSIPRDMLIKVRASSGFGRNAKINSAYALGGENLLISYVEEFTRVEVNYVVKLDYEGFNAIVDAIGGIDMEMKYDMDYDDDIQDLHIHFEKGKKYHLNGKEAEGFFRWRKNNDGTGLKNGDLGRIENQHEFINSLISKIKSPKMIFNIPKLLEILPQYVETNMTPTEIIKYSWKIATAKDGFKMQTLQGDPKDIGGQSYLVYNKTKNEELLSQLKGNLKVSEKGKDEFNMKVLNATGVSGLAGKMEAEMKLRGWTNVDTGNIDVREKSSVMIKYDELKDVIKKESGISNMEEFDMETYGEYDIVIILGKDYEG